MPLLLRQVTTYRRFVNARQQVDCYGQKIVPRAERSLKLVTDGYNIGQVSYLMLLTAQQTYLQVKLTYLDSPQEFWGAVAAI